MESPAASALALPETLGRYELLGVLGRGGMANVYLGRHAGGAGFQRLFAIKVLHPHLAEEEAFVDMLLDEARIAARLHHPNVVPIVDLGSQDGIYYVVMEYVEGCALSVLLKKNRNRRPPRLLIPIILDALSGLHAAHTLTDDDGTPMRLVHRDVSPHNILVGVDGMARLTDFGIAKAESRINTTRPGELKGKVSFMSPEQIKNPDSVDHRSDVFSAGVLLWTALTGKQLFEAASTGASMQNTLSMVVPPPSQVGLEPPAVFDAVCLRALERDRELRLASALGFEESLRATATANGLCGSKREVAEWVLATVGEELTERRNANKSSGNQRIADRIHSFPGNPDTGSDARLRLSRQAGEVTGATDEAPRSHSTAVSLSDPRIESVSVEVVEEYSEPRQFTRKRALIALVALLGIGAVAICVRSFVLKAEPPPAAASASQTTPAPHAAAIATAVTPATKEPNDDAAARHPENPVASAMRATDAGHKRASTPFVARRGAGIADAPRVPTVQPVRVEAPVQASEPRTTKKPLWDEDSPLPPPP